ncbi:MAG: FAD-dependent monooxygenase [Acetobacteraceae bacterium]|nr:FAD-dependent monooxygenase [Acetobacteraceae bacterium]
MSRSPEIVVVGAGVGGGAIAFALAQAGLSVTVLERSERHVDRVRGEWLAPWGVAEAATLGLIDALRAAGGQHLIRDVHYDETVAPEVAEASALDLRQVHPVGTGPMSVGHPAICDAFDEAAIDAGAVLMRGVQDIEVRAGAPPEIAFEHEGVRHHWRPSLVIGADGRTSTVRRQLGMTMLHDPPHHLVGGMLVDGVPDWPREQQSLGTEENLHYLVFPQTGSRVSIYACYGFDGHERFTGPGREQNLLEAFRLRCLPFGNAIAKGTPIGPFHSVSNEDHWVDNPVAPGVVLLGDAAGHNDPITGQGLSITLRDVRILRDLILEGAREPDDFRPYVDDRRERVDRLRVTAQFWSVLHAEFGPEAAARRARALRRAFVEGQLSPIPALFAGPEALPADAFAPATLAALLAPDP